LKTVGKKMKYRGGITGGKRGKSLKKRYLRKKKIGGVRPRGIHKRGNTTLQEG